jgi:hypothetical protein
VENGTATAIAKSYLLVNNTKLVCCTILFTLERSETYPNEAKECSLAEFHAPNP